MSPRKFKKSEKNKGAATAALAPAPAPAPPNLESHIYYGKGKNVNWNHKEVIGPVKNQLECSSCVAHTLCMVVGASYVIDNPGESIPNSAEQNMVDCCTKKNAKEDKNHCQYTTLAQGYRYFKDPGVLDTDVYGEYQARRKECRKPKGRKLAINQWKFCDSKEDIKSKLRERPLSAVVVVTPEFVQFNGKGIYEPPMGTPNLTQDSVEAQHAIVVLDWDVSSDGKEFYLIQNSWGYEWGSQGRARVSADSLHLFSYPIGAQYIDK